MTPYYADPWLTVYGGDARERGLAADRRRVVEERDPDAKPGEELAPRRRVVPVEARGAQIACGENVGVVEIEHASIVAHPRSASIVRRG